MPAVAAASRRLSLRDPAGTLWHHEGRLLRAIGPSGAADLRAFLEATVSRAWTDRGDVVETRVLHPEDIPGPIQAGAVTDRLDVAMVVEHAPVPFASYAYEWSGEMLRAAALLTLDLAEGLLGSGLGLKDATPYNVLFRGARPVFVDVLSFERRDPHEHTWLAYGQFVRTFLLPLLAYSRLGMAPSQVFVPFRDGLDPEHLASLVGWPRLLIPPFLGLVGLPALLGRLRQAHVGGSHRRRHDDPEQARFVLSWHLRRLRHRLQRLTLPTRSRWMAYEQQGPYSQAAAAAKEAVVRGALDHYRPHWVLDVGCNTGRFSLVAAQTGADVVAIDTDPTVVSRLFLEARSAGLGIQPLVVDLARPTPAIGWGNRECASFLDRAQGRFDGLLLLAVVHHLLVTEGIPLPEIAALAGRLTSRLAIVEFVPRDDPMFTRIARGRDDLYSWYDRAAFETCWREHFDLVDSQSLPGTGRVIFVMVRR